MGSGPVATATRVLARYEAAGGGLIAGGLAYAALFALVPAVLLLAGVTGLLISDPATQRSVVDTIAGVIPPLRDLARSTLDQAARGAAPVSVIGFVGLLWGASRFAVSFQDAIERTSGGSRRRGFLRANLDAFIAVMLLVAALLGVTIVSGVLAFVDAGTAAGVVSVIGQGIGIALAVLPILGVVAAVALVYRIVPVNRPSWTAIRLPASVVGLSLWILAQIFVFISPRLIGAAALLGTLASVFAALAWLALSFQALLLGAAWTGERHAPTGPPPSAPPPVL
ncbi:MAG TPA: YihY/virulence factor BrkB family protein [Candidatus Limnocylindrales bacterium]|nr:YihY/virulence factor BrkB family protein [Candidatus Limnocylindrales bacterium]